VNCVDTPADQENVVASLHWCETIAALSLLEEGGTFVIKVFTLFEESSVTLLFLLNCFFDRVEVFKPTTSKAGNSECYVLAKGFRDKATWEGRFAHTLISHYGPNLAKEASEMISELVPLSFLQCHYRCIQFFSEHQQNHILENISVHSLTDQKEYDVAMKHILNVQQQVSREVFVRSRIKPISMQEHLVPAQFMRDTPATIHFPRQLHEGSYNERREEMSLPWPSRIKTKIPKQFSFVTSPFSIAWKVSSAFPPNSEFFDVCHVTRGRRAPVCKNSIFCDYQATTDWNLASSCASLRPEVMRRIDDRVIDGIVKAFLDDLGKYYVQEPELFDYLLVRDANYEQSHRDFLTNGGHVVSYFSCVDDENHMGANNSSGDNINLSSDGGGANSGDGANSSDGGNSSDGVGDIRSPSEEESTSAPKMLQLLRSIFVEKSLLKGSHVLLRLPVLFSRFSASFVYLLSSYFDLWGLGVADSFVRDSQDTNAFRPSASLPSYFFFGANFRLEADNRSDEAPLKAASDFVSLLFKDNNNPEDSKANVNSPTVSRPEEADSAITSLNVESVSSASSRTNLSASKDKHSSISGNNVDKFESKRGSQINNAIGGSINVDPSNNDVLQFIPLPLLTDADFLPFIRASNVNLIQKRLNFLVEWEKTAEKEVDEGVGDEVVHVGEEVDEVVVEDANEPLGDVGNANSTDVSHFVTAAKNDADQKRAATMAVIKPAATALSPVTGTSKLTSTASTTESPAAAFASATTAAITSIAAAAVTSTAAVVTSTAAVVTSTAAAAATSAVTHLKTSPFSSSKGPPCRENGGRRRKRSGDSRRSSKHSSNDPDGRGGGGGDGRGSDRSSKESSSRRGSTDDDMPSKSRRKEKSVGGLESVVVVAAASGFTPSGVSATPSGVSATPSGVSATPLAASVTPETVPRASKAESESRSLAASPVLDFDFE